MNKKYFLYGLFSLGLIFCCATSIAKQSTPIGYWIQINDITGRPHSIIQIEEKQNILYGKVIKGLPVNGKMPAKYCINCSGKRYNKPIVGMTIMWGFYQTDTYQWAGGKILDPDSGRIYNCKLTLIDNGQALEVRGYVGISLFGRTQIWKRTNQPKS